MLKYDAANLLAAPHGNCQATLGAELAYCHLREGGHVVQLVESAGDVSAGLARCQSWFRARRIDFGPHGDRLQFLTNYRTLHDPEKLAEAITVLASGIAPLVWCDISHGVYVEPEHPWLARAVALRKALPGVTVLSVISTGADAMPLPPLSNFVADAIYQVKSSGVAMKLFVTPIMPEGPPIKFVCKIAQGVPLFDIEETEHV